MTKIKTVGIDPQTGLSRLAVTPKKKSKMKKIIPAVIAGAALFAGVGALGGTTAAAGGGSIFSKLGAGLKSLLGIGSKAAVGAGRTWAGSAATGIIAGPQSTPSNILGTLFEGITKAGGAVYDKFKGMSYQDAFEFAQVKYAKSKDETDFTAKSSTPPKDKKDFTDEEAVKALKK